MEKILSVLEEADIIVGDHTFKMKITRDMCKAMKKVKLILQPSTGYDHIDVEACARKGIPVAGIANAPSTCCFWRSPKTIDRPTLSFLLRLKVSQYGVKTLVVFEKL